jgi:uncharacterized membrane protein
MNLYDFLKSVHVLAAVIWVGGAFTMQLLGTRAVSSRDPQKMAAFGQSAEFMGTRVFMPASLVVLVFGVWAVFEGSWSWGDFWILWGLVGVLFSAIVGASYLGPESARVGALSAQRGADDSEVVRRRDRLVLVSRIELVILLTVVFVMVTKPGA